MRIALLGPENAGQTSYIASIYNYLARNRVNNFQLHGPRKTDIRLSNIWKNIVLKNIFPEKSYQSENFQFDFWFEEETLTDVEFYTFPGLEVDKGEVFLQRFTSEQFDGLMIFLSIEDIFKEDETIIHSIECISEIIKKYITANNNENANIAFVITKGDICTSHQKESLVSQSSLVLQKLKNQIYKQDGVIKIALFLVSSIGGNNFSQSHQSSKDLDDLVPYNIEAPFFFLMEQCFTKQANIEEKRLWKDIDEVFVQIQNFSLKLELRNIVLKTPTQKSKIIECIASINLLRSSVEKRKRALRYLQKKYYLLSEGINI